MAAPTPTPRVTPLGIYLDDGFSTKITFAADTDVALWEKTVTPPGIDGGDPIETVTMHNLIWRPKRPRQLKTLTDCTFTAAYDPVIYTQIVALCNVETTITVTFPDGTTVAFYGFLQKVEPGELTEGEFPELTATIVPTNWDPVNHVEAGPALASVAGT